MVVFLSKPAESEGFEQIVDFLNANPINYALTINPTIYISCIEQFWSTVKAKTVNGEVQLHALVDGKKIIITESIVRRDLQLEDAEGVDCLPNATIFDQLALMGYELICNFDTDKIMARMDAMTLKIDAQYKELQTQTKKTKPNLDEDDIPMSREGEAKFMQTFRKTRFYNDYRDRDSNRDNWRSNERSSYNQDNYRSNIDDKPYDLQKQFNDFMKSQQSTNAFIKETFMDLKTQLETVAKNHQASIQNLETKFDRLADKQSGQQSGSLPSNTQPNPKGHNSKAYQPPQSRNEHVNDVFTRSRKSYDPPVYPNNQNDSETPINFDSDDEDEEPIPQPKTQTSKPIKETPLPKPYKPKIHYPQLLRKEKMEAQYGKFLDMIRAVRIN
ncbi:hypothetical protein Tco_0897413, partial [Tanacetum coccineum]